MRTFLFAYHVYSFNLRIKRFIFGIFFVSRFLVLFVRERERKRARESEKERKRQVKQNVLNTRIYIEVIGLGRVCETSRLFIKYVCCRKRSTLLLLIFSPVQFYFHSIETLDFFRCCCCFPSTLLLFGGVALFFHFVIFTTLASKSLEVNSNRYQFSIETSLHAKSV